MGLHTLLSAAAGSAWRERFGSTASLTRYADRQLRQLLNHAHEHVPFQRRRLRKAKRWEDIEPTGKSEMMAHFGESLATGMATEDEVQRMVADQSSGSKWIRDEYLVAQTSGTTGERGVVVIDRHCWESHRAAIFTRTIRGVNPLRRLKGLLRGEKFRLAMLVADYPFCTTFQSGRTSQRHGSRTAVTELLSIMSSLDENIDRLNQFQPHYLYLYPSYLRAIAQARLNGSPVHFDPITLTVGCEVLTDPDRELIRRAFPESRLINQYGATECLALGIGCPAGPLHLNTDFVRLEPVDAHYRAVPTGEFSDRVLVTNLTNRVQPIIRHELTDSVRILSEPCICGSPLPVIEIRGRADDVLHLVDANNRIRECLPMPIYVSLISCPNLDFVQLVHTRQNELTLRIVPAPTANRRHVAETARVALQSVLAKEGLQQTVQIHVQIVDSLTRMRGAGKLKVVLSEVRPAQAAAYGHLRAA